MTSLARKGPVDTESRVDGHVYEGTVFHFQSTSRTQLPFYTLSPILSTKGGDADVLCRLPEFRWKPLQNKTLPSKHRQREKGGRQKKSLTKPRVAAGP